ncbi:thiamine biosynthesis lipoprotein [Antricoccus suffuscus]|uniref:FAD:protein FMN transferase n=1 Tax=Antricoccus suffuscus TaxID=1629062 RepID=A0A2T0ZXH1_9ACTN|nr:FAD:protein FMN transferase [Antricoccus suffuscus]PRZ41059.1 thiamine biosynthesis lipoprotein [Antricoccus suffuscus]
MTDEAPLSVFNEMIMGLPFSLHVRGPADRERLDSAVEQVWESLRTADATFSTYKSDSAISRLNRDEPLEPDERNDVDGVLDLAEEIRVITDGAFDVRHSGIVDPAGIVKGWAAARAAEFLRPLGVGYYLNAGGDIVLHASCDQPAWRIGIEHPLDPSGLLAILELPGGAVATSGSAHRGNHIIDPHTGAPATGFAQVTVVGPSLVTADIAATALMVTGSVNSRMSTWLEGYEILAVTRDSRAVATRGMSDKLVTELAHQTFDL